MILVSLITYSCHLVYDTAAPHSRDLWIFIFMDVNCIFVSFNDILVFSESKEQHCKDLMKVLSILEENTSKEITATFYRFWKNIPFHKIVVNLGIKVEFESIPVSFLLQSEQPTKEDKWMDLKKKRDQLYNLSQHTKTSYSLYTSSYILLSSHLYSSSEILLQYFYTSFNLFFNTSFNTFLYFFLYTSVLLPV